MIGGWIPRGFLADIDTNGRSELASGNASDRLRFSRAGKRPPPRRSPMASERSPDAPVTLATPSSRRCPRTSASSSRAAASSSSPTRQAHTPSAPSSTRSRRARPTSLGQCQGALEVLRHLQAAGARRARQEDARLLLHGADQESRPAASSRRRSGSRSTTPPTASPTARCASPRARASSTTTCTGPKLAPLVRHLNRHYREEATLGACGDVNRNVMSSPVDGARPALRPRAGASSPTRSPTELAPKSSRLLPGVPVRRGGPEPRAAEPTSSRSTARSTCRASSRSGSPTRTTTRSTC